VFGWIKFLDRGRRILDLIEGHLRIVRQMVDQMMNTSDCVKKMDWNELDRIWGILDILENEADQAHESIVATICEGSYFGGIFSELLLLTEKIDDIADSAKDAIRTLTQRKLDEAIVRCMLKTDDFHHFLEKCRNAVYTLDDAVRGLGVNRQTALEKVNGIKKHEEDADLYKSRLLKVLFGECPTVDTLGVLQWQNFINTADQIADNAEDAGDLIRVLITRGYG